MNSGRPGRPPSSRSFRGDRRAWALLLVLGVTATIAGRAWLHRTVVSFDDLPVQRVDDFRLAVLAYDRLSTMPDGRHVHAEQFSEHLASLKDAGYTPVTLAQVQRAFDRHSGLPARSILLTFDSGYLSTYSAADPALRRRRWPGVMLLDVRYQIARAPGFLYWDRLARMVSSGIWEIGVHGPMGAATESEQQIADSTAAWLDGREALEERLPGHPPRAYAPRFGADWPLDLGSRGFTLGLTDGTLGVNSRSSDPRHLVRVRVNPTWSGKQLVERLNWAANSAVIAGGDGSGAPLLRRWIPESGRVTIDGDSIVVDGATRAGAWLAGSRWATDWILEATILSDADEFWLVQSGGTGGVLWRWGGTPEALYLQVLREDEAARVLVREPRSSDEATSRHRLRAIRRGAGLWIEWNGTPVTRSPFALPADLRGDIGFVVAGASGAARLRVASIRFEAIPFLVEPLDPEPSTERIQALVRLAPRLAAVSPILLEWSGNGLREHPVDRDLLAMLSHRYGWEILPTLVAHGSPPAVGPTLCDGVTERIRREAWAGMRLDLSRVAAREREGWERMADRWSREFSRHGLRLIVASTAGAGGGRP